MIRFYLDGTLYENPDGWDELRSKIKRDENLNAVLIFQEASVEFTGDAYTYLYDKLITEGFCSVVEIEVQQSCSDGNTYQTLFKGRIFLSDCEFNERTGKAQAKLEDNSYYSLIKNNAKIKTALDTDLTKNGQPLAQAPVYEVDFYSVGANTLVKSDVPCMRVYDAFKYLISFMSDNRIGFASSLFDLGGRWEGLCITTGERIRTNTATPWEQINFVTLLNEIYYATEPLIMIIEDPYGSPVIRIEDKNYSYANSTNFLLENVYEVVTGVEQEKLYSSVTVGSSNVDDTFTYPFPELVDFFGFKSEQLFLTGECNIDNDLQLVGDFIRSSNLIERQLLNQDYDKEYFIINTELATSVTGRTTNTNVFNESPAQYYYNDALRNSEIMNRWNGGLPSNLIKYVGSVGDGLFKATSTGNQTIGIPLYPLGSPIQFTNEVYDNGNNYNAVDTYTAPITGVYYFDVSGFFIPVAPSTSGAIYIVLRIFDNTSTLKNTINAPFAIIPNTGRTVNRTLRAIMNATDYAQVWISYIDGSSITATATLLSGASFECTANTIGGAAYNTYNPEDYPVLTYTFEYPLTDNQFNSLILNPIGKIGFAMASQPFRYGWVKDISYNHINKSANIKLITSQNNAT